MRWTEAIGNRLHVGDRRRRGPHAETAVARSQHRCIVIFTHHPVGNENCVQCHHQRLYGQDRQHWQRQRSQLPQTQAHQRHRQEQRQANVAQHRHRTLKHGIEPGEGQGVAEDHPNEQHANKVG